MVSKMENIEVDWECKTVILNRMVRKASQRMGHLRIDWKDMRG